SRGAREGRASDSINSRGWLQENGHCLLDGDLGLQGLEDLLVPAVDRALGLLLQGERDAVPDETKTICHVSPLHSRYPFADLLVQGLAEEAPTRLPEVLFELPELRIILVQTLLRCRNRAEIQEVLVLPWVDVPEERPPEGLDVAKLDVSIAARDLPEAHVVDRGLGGQTARFTGAVGIDGIENRDCGRLLSGPRPESSPSGPTQARAEGEQEKGQPEDSIPTADLVAQPPEGARVVLEQ